MQKNYIYITFISLVILSFLSSCKRDNEGIDESGYIEFSLGVDDRFNVEIERGSATTKSIAEAPESRIELYRGDDMIYSFDHPSETGEAALIERGDYTIKAYSIYGRENEANFDIKKYDWSNDVTINPFENNSVDITMGLSVAKVTVAFEDDFINLMGSENISVIVNNNSNGSLRFTPESSNKEGYFDPIDGKFTYTINVTRENGTVYSSSYNQTLNAADHLNLTFGLNDDLASDNIEDAMFNITVNQNLNEVITDIYLDLSQSTTPPTFSSNFDISAPVEISASNGLTQDYTCQFSSATGLRNIYFNGEKETFSKYGLDRSTDILNLGATQATKFEDAGIAIEKVIESNVTTSASIDFTNFISKLSPGDEGEHSYPFIITIIDKALNSIERSFVLKVVGDRVRLEEVYSTPTSSSEATTANLNLVAEWLSDQYPETTAVLYRVKGETDWNISNSSDITLNNTTKKLTFSKQVAQNKSYECKLANVDESGNIIDEQDIVIEHLIENNLSVPNMNFDSWHNDGSTYYPNASDGNSYWASGNEGVTMWPVSKDSNCQPESSLVVKGKAVKMFTYTGITMVGVAAGNLFTGTYKTNMSDPASSVSFGRPFAGARPKSLTGYFMYSSGGDVDGAPDKCNIYVELRSDGERVGFGELLTDRTVMSYEQFKFDITYTSDAVVDEIVIVATSSYLGGEFKGAAGSQLYVDEFEFRY